MRRTRLFTASMMLSLAILAGCATAGQHRHGAYVGVEGGVGH